MTTYSTANSTLELDLRSTWGSGLVADLTLTPTQALNGWTVTFDYPGDIANIWNAQIVSRVGDRYVVEQMGYNANVPAGGSVSFGFQGSGSVHEITPVALRDEAIGAPADPPVTADPPVISVTASTVTEGDPTTGTMTAGPLIADGPLSTSGNQIVDSNGNAVQIRAVNWFGAENDVRAPHGLWQRPMTEMMDQMVAEGFNAIRLPFSVQNILEDQVATSVGGDPSLAGLTTLEIFDRIIAYAEDIGIKIILDAHRITQGNGAEGIWYSRDYDEADWIDAWEVLATRYGDSTAVIGADLLNEPHLGTWGTGARNDWAAAAEQAGNAVLDVAPNWLILVEGIGTYDGESYWWGGQLQGVRDRPVVLAVDDKLVYSPHDYPASIFNQPWFNDGSNLYDVFRENWGFIYEEGIAPVLLGEFGSRLENPQDLIWAEAITNYLSGDFDGDGVSDLGASDAGPSFAWWSWNPNSGDTGGYVLDDWTTVRQGAADLLDPLLSADAGASGDSTTALTFDVSLDAPATEPLSYDYEIRDGTAIADEDYVAATGKVDFAVGQQVAQITVLIIADTNGEADETLSLVVTDADGTETSATGTIIDDDTGAAEPVNVMVTGGSVTESDPNMVHMHDDGTSHVHDDGHRYITFTIALETPATQEITLGYTTIDGSAVADTSNDVAWDYHTALGELVFAIGEQTKTVAVKIHPDTLVEETESFTFAVSGNVTGTLQATGAIVDNDTAPMDDDDTDMDHGDMDDGSMGDDNADDTDDDTDVDTSGPFVGGGTTYNVGQQAVITGFDPAKDVLDLGPNSIHNQIPVDTADGFMMLHMFNPSLSTLVEGVSLADLHPENFAPIADGHLQQDMSAILAYEDGSGLVRPNTVYLRSHEEGLEEIVDFNPATDKISFFYLSVRGDGKRNFAVEDTAEGARFFNPLTGQSLTLRDVSFSDLDSSHFEWRANQLEDNIAGRIGLTEVIDGFEYVSANIFSGKSVAMAGGVDRAPYHSQPDYSGTPIGDGGADDGDVSGGQMDHDDMDDGGMDDGSITDDMGMESDDHADHDHGDDHGQTGDATGPYVDITSYGIHHGTSSHTHHDSLEGGRTAITTEALVAYNALRNFLGLEDVSIDDVGTWAFANGLTNNTQAWGGDLQGVGLWYAMQGAKVGWMADASFDPQLVADTQRLARQGETEAVMALVAANDHDGFAEFLSDNGLVDSFINTLRMEPHYGGWMHGRTHGWLSFPEGNAIAHDVNHLTVLSHDQMQPFMNDTFDWPQWPALDVPLQDVIDYFQAMVVLGNPLGDALPGDAPAADPVEPTPVDPAPADPDPVDTGDNNAPIPEDAFTLGLDDWGSGFVARFNLTPVESVSNGWEIAIATNATVTNLWGGTVLSHEDGILRVGPPSWSNSVNAGQTIEVGFQASGSSADLALISSTLPLGQTQNGGNETGDDFLFYAQSSVDVIPDFESGDRIGIAADINGTGIDDPSDALARLSQSGNDAILDLGQGYQVTLQGIQAGTLTVEDFFVF